MPVLGYLGSVLACFGAMLARFGATLARFGAMLKLSWDSLAALQDGASRRAGFPGPKVDSEVDSRVDSKLPLAHC